MQLTSRFGRLVEAGTVIAGDYRVDELLGDGGMGVVYRALQLSLERKVALKLLAPALSVDPNFRERFRREGRIQARIDHPHIIDVYGAGESEYGLYLAMRLVNGATLKDLIVRRELEPHRALTMLQQVASALDAAHEASLIHRDVKPQNILIDTSRWHSYLADFGVTKARDTTGLTRANQLVGTIDYMAPEQFAGSEASEFSDVYAFGAVVYETLTGSVPFARPTEAAVMYAHLHDAVPPVRELRPELPPALDAVIQKAMAKNPEERYESAVALTNDVARALVSADTATRSGEPLPAPLLGRGGPAAPETSVSPPDPPRAPETSVSPPESPAAADTSVSPAAPDTAASSPEPRAPETTVSPPEPPPAPATTVSPPQPPPAPEPSVPKSSVAPETTVSPPERPPAPGTALSSPRPPSAPKTSAPRVSAAPETTVRPPKPAPPRTETTIPVPDLAAPAREPVLATARRRTYPLLAAAALAVLALAAAGFLVGHRAHQKVVPVSVSAVRDVRGGALTLAVPPSWRSTTGRTLPGLPLRREVALSSGDSRVVAGTSPLAWPTLVPTSFRRVVRGALPRPAIVRIGKLQALRYRQLRLRGTAGAVTIFAIPQPRAETVVACSSATASGLRSCEGVAASVRVAGAKPYRLSLSPSYAKALNRALADLATRRRTAVRTLSAAGTAAAQSAAIARIASAYSRAARAVAGEKPSAYVAPAHRQLVSDLRRVAHAYTALAAAASAGESARYDALRRVVRSRDHDLQAGLGAFRPLGFGS